MPDIFDYKNTMDPAYAGMIAETQFKDAASRRVESNIGFGLAVCMGTSDNTAMLGGTKFLGISIADKGQGINNQYLEGAVGSFLRKGTIWVVASTAVAAGDPVTFTAATGVLGAGLAVTITGAVFETTGAAGELVRVYLG